MPPRIITCEHASNAVPPELRRAFAHARAALNSHRGWDIGALPIAEQLAAAHASPLFVGRWTRLAVDLNRSPSNPALLSEFTRKLPPDQRARLIADHYTPYRTAVGAHTAIAIKTHGRALHLSVHTFTPVMKGKPRNLDIGLLFDHRRTHERDLCERWRDAINGAHPGLRVRFNLPYRGASDGLTAHLRTIHSADAYTGVELEVNQALVATRARATRVGAMLATTLPRAP